jgi:hypothetical protein
VNNRHQRVISHLCVVIAVDVPHEVRKKFGVFPASNVDAFQLHPIAQRHGLDAKVQEGRLLFHVVVLEAQSLELLGECHTQLSSGEPGSVPRQAFEASDEEAGPQHSPKVLRDQEAHVEARGPVQEERFRQKNTSNDTFGKVD